MGNKCVIDTDEQSFRAGVRDSEGKELQGLVSLTAEFAQYRRIVRIPNSQENILLLECEFKTAKNNEKGFKELLRKLLENYGKPTETHIFIVTGYYSDAFIAFLTEAFQGIPVSFEFVKEKQIPATISGLDFLSRSKENWVYKFDEQSKWKLGEIKNDSKLSRDFVQSEKLNQPYILVNLRGGLSFYSVLDPKNFKRLGGSIIGETTCLNLINFFSKGLKIQEALDLGLSGDYRNVDMTVKDIYGEDFMKGILDGDILASSLGKACGAKNDRKDVMRSVFIMSAINIAQLTVLYAQNEQAKRVFVVSSLLRNEKFNALIQCGLQFFAKPGETEFFFVEGGEFLPCIGGLDS